MVRVLCVCTMMMINPYTHSHFILLCDTNNIHHVVLVLCEVTASFINNRVTFLNMEMSTKFTTLYANTHIHSYIYFRLIGPRHKSNMNEKYCLRFLFNKSFVCESIFTFRYVIIIMHTLRMCMTIIINAIISLMPH